MVATDTLLFSASCAHGFADVGNSHGSRQRFQNEQWIFPNTNFTCSGQVTTVIFQIAREGSTVEEYPEFQIWRMSEDNPETYLRVGSVTLNCLECEGPDGVFTTNVTAAQLLFESSDVVGVFIPRRSRGRTLQFEGDNGLLAYYQVTTSALDLFTLDDGQDSDALPLIAVEISK